MTWRFSLKKTAQSHDYNLEKFSGWGWREFIKKEYILKDYYNQNGFLKFTISLEVFREPTHETVDPPKPVYRQSGLAFDFGFLLENQDIADVVFTVGEKSFKAQRVVLAAIFRGGFEESNKSAFEVEDIEPKTFEVMLRFIYTNRLDNFDGICVEELLATADKYALEELVAICEKHLCSEIKEKKKEDVLDCLTLADAHSRKDLKESALNHIRENHKEIIGKSDWENLKKENPAVAVEALDKVIRQLVNL